MPRSYQDLPVEGALEASGLSEPDNPAQSAQGISECVDSCPAGGAAHAVRFSIRDLLLATAVIACVLGGFTMYGFFGASSIALTCGALLVVFGRRRKKPLLVRLGTALAIPSFCIWGAMMAGWMMFGLGPIYSVQAFPAELKDMAAICNADISAARVEGLGSFIDSQYAWELPLSPAQFKRVVAKQTLVPVPVKTVPPSFWHVFPRGWRPSHNEYCRYYATPNFPATHRGPDGEYYFAMYDSQSQRIYVWYKFNF